MLDIAYYEAGPADGPVAMLMHGFPYDIHSYVDVAPLLAARGMRVIVPYLRGYAPTRFLDAATMRSGEQAAIGADLIALMDALGIERAVVAGYDWGGRAACVAAALFPQRCIGLVSVNSYLIQDIAKAQEPVPPQGEVPLWYQYYFHQERGRRGLEMYRREIARLLWTHWSPDWKFDDATFERSAVAFDSPDYVDIVVHSYRHRFGLVPGDARYAGASGRTRPAARDLGADHHARRRRRRCRSRDGRQIDRIALQRQAHAPRHSWYRPQSAAGSAGCLRRGGRGTRRRVIPHPPAPSACRLRCLPSWNRDVCFRVL